MYIKMTLIGSNAV